MQIYQVQNFLTTEELSQIQSIIDELPKDNTSWTLDTNREDVEEDLHPWWSGKIYRIGQTELLWKIYERLYDKFIGCDGIDISHIIDFQRTLPGDQSMTIHTDNLGDGNIKYGIVIYLNDDYTGGEIFYPDHNLTIKPTVGMLAVHASDIPHGVAEVFDGPRYILTSFVRCSHDYQCGLKFTT